MGTNGKSFADLAASFREISCSPASLDASDATSLIAEFVQAAERSAKVGNGDDPFKADAVLNLYRIIQASKDTQIVKSSLSALLKAGRFGRVLATRFVHGKAISQRDLTSKVSTFPPDTRLALAHEMLLESPDDHDKQTKSWLESLMSSLATVEPEKLAPFVAELGREGTHLAFPARQVLMNNQFGKWIETHLETGASGKDLDALCHMVLALNDSKQAETLAVSMQIGFISPTPLALRTVAEVAEAGTKPILDMYLKVLKGAGAKLAGPCLDGIIAQQSNSAGKLLATIRMKMPSMQKTAAIRVPLLGETAYRTYLAALPKEVRGKAEKDAFAALLALAPDFVESLTRTGTAIGAQLPPQNGTIEAQNGSGEDAACAKPGFFARLFGGRKATLEKSLTKFRNIRDMELPCSNLENEELDGRELTSLNLAKSRFANVKFIRTKLASCDCVDSTFTDCEANGSAFNNTNFAGADLTGVTFTQCSFNDCNFNHAAFAKCKFIDCKFRNCSLAGTALLSVTMRLTGFTTSVLSGATFFETDIRICRFEESDFTDADITSATFKGVEFHNCVIIGATLYGSTFHAVDMPGCTLNSCHINNTDASHALFLSNMTRQLTGFANRLEGKSLPDPKTVQPEVASKVLLAWARELSLLRREEHMQRYNRARLGHAINAMERSQQLFLRILPHMLNTDVFEKKFGLQNVPPCEVWGYTSSLTAVELSKQFFPELQPGKNKSKVRILAVYAMGSLGTVAQTTTSDLDCWVCYDGDINLDVETGLKRKLDALGLWAESEFGLEAHFFPMRMEDVRENRFASGDEESSGSAQALLLKEEFYRTALRLAGKHIAWWVTPPGANKTTYDTCIQSTRRYPLAGRPRMEDFGHLTRIPPDEYFGGSLWQIVKAVHYPFKSVLKLGLLETYADPKASSLPLCDRIKHNLFMNRQGVLRTDPYAALFHTLRSHYARRGDKEAAGLLVESFKFKANLCDIPFFLDFPARAEDASLVTALFGKGFVDPDKVCNSDAVWTFDKSLKTGSSVRRYMVTTYQRIQRNMQKDGGGETLINAEDLTRMGRRIGSNFSQKKHKIMRVPFMDAKGSAFTTLHLSAEKAPGKKTVWAVRGGSKAEAKKSVDSLQLLHRSGDPVHMFAWLLANRIYNPSVLFQADRTIAPIAVADLQKLMPAMHEFFPFDDTFERDINEGLEAERVIRVFFIFNLTVPPDAKNIEQAAVIYTTNWGEMFCRTFLKPSKLIEERPSQFLAQHLDHPVQGIPDMVMFLPKGSQCKRINLI